MPNILMPAYAASFQCIGPACEDNCCHTWSVVYSREHMRWLHGHAGHQAVAEALDSLAPYEGPGKGEFVMRMRPDGKCPLLSADGLCRLQAEIGPEALTDICTRYPRIYNEINGTYEMSMTLTCPEVARSCLCDQNGIEFVTQEQPTPTHLTNRYRLRRSPNVPPAAKYFEKIRTFSLRVLKTRAHSMEYRLLFLGFFLRKMADCGDSVRMPVLLSAYEEMFVTEDFSGQFDQMQPDIDFQLLFWQRMMQQRQVDVRSSYPRVYYEAFELLNGPDQNITPESFAAVRKHYDENIGRYMYMVENYLVNELFRTCLPFQNELDVWKGYQEIVHRYSLLKLHLIALAAKHQGLDEETIVRGVFAFERGILYGSPYAQNCLRIMEENGWNQMQLLAALIID